MRAAVMPLLFAGVITVHREAAASPSAKLVYLRGRGTESCPPEADLRKAVAVRLGYDPFFPAAQKTVVAEVGRGVEGYRARVRIVVDDGTVRGERELATKGDDCGELIFALALAVSIALDDLDEEVPSPPPHVEPPSTTADSPPGEEPPRADRPPARDAPTVVAAQRAELAVGIGPTLSLGTAPDAAAGASLGAALLWPRIGIRVDARAELPASASIAAGGRVSTNIAVSTSSICYRLGAAFVCAGGGAGAVWSRTEGITKPARDSALIVIAALKLGIDITFGSSFFVQPQVDLGAHLLPYRVDVDGVTAHEPSPVWGALGIYTGAKFH